ncbi:hypothetical protein ACHAWO_010422, partial [Cyclotella atomus]
APYLDLQKRLRSDSNAIFVFNDVHIKTIDFPAKTRHRRAPTCPAFKMKSSITLETEDTDSLTDSECSIADDKLVLWKRSSSESSEATEGKMHCYDAFVSFSRNEPSLEASFRIIRSMSKSNLIDVSLRQIDVTSVCQLISKKAMKELRKIAFRRLFKMPSLYLSILHTTAGFMLTIGALDLGISPWNSDLLLHRLGSVFVRFYMHLVFSLDEGQRRMKTTARELYGTSRNDVSRR